MKIVVVISIILAALIPTVAYGQAGLWPGALGSGAVGLLWLVGQGYGRSWTAGLGFVSLVGLAAVGAWLGLPPAWLLGGVTAALVAWDLAGFSRRLAWAGPGEGRSELWHRHWRRLFSAAGLGLVAGSLALSLRLNLGLAWTLVMGLLLILALAYTVRAGRQRQD